MNEPTTRSLDELLGKETYVYQGKTYARRDLYKASSLKTVLITAYVVVVVVAIGGVAAWSLGATIPLPDFLLGIQEEAPVVQVRERAVAPPVAPAEVATTTDANGQVSTSVEVVGATSTASTTTQ
ncbi:hypothetical protein A3C89_03435 [Candidatus Kaiserbacteria bacterium RIFCSPHIGHO2_02_FULL_50_50]|uniref:Uncharacterized protein n=1 Tax=Candidatus Kaiserbacteria bacterium RIFCSPHIGHO2_02_FULL_50_50 TaxID=1798492 RepID=A0A1F6DEW6_9BACT|nr:MAG: hypothetical protein A3C89_03435 [Candidatus Kaiserbacteria bacterium RIFCSPHIGHO2_02_FULL_50_50]OGG89220.1 MAG: hypothetical protein A3G62_01185 [Candidatus Kaiserbacteria bacterium RIFCSPLOWO2_12_FULL_50_10]